MIFGVILTTVGEVVTAMRALFVEKLMNHDDAAGESIGPMSKKRKEQLNPLVAPYLKRYHDAAVSLRQASEWGMRVLQGTFTRLKSRDVRQGASPPYYPEHGAFTNFRTTHVGLNQITRVFNPNYEQNINLDGYGRLNPIYYGGVERHRVLFLFYFFV